MKFITKLKILSIITAVFITYLICIFGADAQNYLIIFILYPFLVVCSLCFYDIDKFLVRFYNFIKQINNYTRKKEDIKFCTPLGKLLNDYFLYLERKVFLLKKDGENLKKDDLNNPINFLKKLDIDPELTEEEFFKNILNILSGFYQKNAIVLFYYDQNTSECFSISSLSSNKHISMFLRQMFLSYIINKKEIKLGVVNYYNVENVLEDLSLFGYKSAIVKKIHFNDESNNSTIMYLWFGSSTNDINFFKCEHLIDSLSYEIGSQYETFLKLKSAKNEIEKKTQEAVKKSEYLEFVSHDLRSPLSNLVTILKLLEVNTDEKNKKEFIEIALNNCDSISLLLEDLLDFSKYKNSGLEVCKEKFLVANEIEGLVKNFYLKAVQKNLNLTFINRAKNIFVDIDKRQFKKIINNIISNAIKYTNKGHIDVDCSVVRNKVIVTISDTGVGIDDNELKDIFGLFKRGSDVENLEGYGLGLFMVKVFSDLNNIDVAVESKKGEGTKFILKLVCIKECKKENQITKDKYKKVVLIEDDEDLLTSTKRLLELHGYLVQGFSTVNDAKEFLISNKVDLILTDYYIGVDRVDVLLNFLRNKKIKTNIVILTGKTDIDINEYKKLGVKKILNKPLNINML